MQKLQIVHLTANDLIDISVLLATHLLPPGQRPLRSSAATTLRAFSAGTGGSITRPPAIWSGSPAARTRVSTWGPR